MSTITSVIGKSGLYPEIPVVDVEDVEKLSPFQEIPEEILLIIFGYLSLRDQDTACCVCRRWRVVGNDETLKEIKAFAFGATKWKRHFGDVGVEPPLPDSIFRIFRGPCPFWPEKRLQDTHLLLLIPETVNGKHLALSTFLDLIKTPKIGEKTKYKYYYDTIKASYENKSFPSHWCLMTRAVLPNSREKSYDIQKDLTAFDIREDKSFYTMPTILDAAVSILVHYMSAEKQLYIDNKMENQRIYTQCQETIENNQCLEFFARGSKVCFSFWPDNNYYGVRGSRKFPCKPLILDMDNDQLECGGKFINTWPGQWELLAQEREFLQGWQDKKKSLKT